MILEPFVGRLRKHIKKVRKLCHTDILFAGLKQVLPAILCTTLALHAHALDRNVCHSCQAEISVHFGAFCIYLINCNTDEGIADE